ncbi:MAG: DUF420 domain-containing protein [Alphaproteobacteria bacterium]|nr:DUF420 domain-containing protein [Alphaproteobacteria bacterium]
MTAAMVLPHVNAALNATTTVLLLLGFVFIRTGNRYAHRTAMIAAMVVSAMFLVSYVTYHLTSPIFMFRGQGLIRQVYYGIMISHVLLAMVATPMVAITASRSLRGQFKRHKAIARWTLPVWLYVSLTGIIVYIMLYHLYPDVPPP